MRMLSDGSSLLRCRSASPSAWALARTLVVSAFRCIALVVFSSRCTFPHTLHAAQRLRGAKRNSGRGETAASGPFCSHLLPAHRGARAALVGATLRALHPLRAPRVAVPSSSPLLVRALLSRALCFPPSQAGSSGPAHAHERVLDGGATRWSRACRRSPRWPLLPRTARCPRAFCSWTSRAHTEKPADCYAWLLACGRAP